MILLLIILSCSALRTLASPMYQTVDVKDDGSYRFAFETGKDGGSHSRTEQRNANGVVTGKFSYEDPNGDIREVSYKADDLGYIAHGDVSVEGAPKGQFPVILEPQDERQPLSEPVVEDEKPHFENQEEPLETTESPDSEETHKEEEIQELPSEDSTVDDPPEAFPAGYFLEKFHGLRRLPEPTKEQPSSTTTAEEEEEASSVEEPSSDVAQEQQQSTPDDQSTQSPPAKEASNAQNEDLNQIIRDPKAEMDLFVQHMRPFHGFPSPQWAPSMLHQPVYVFSYQHPESYGYHYYY